MVCINRVSYSTGSYNRSETRINFSDFDCVSFILHLKDWLFNLFILDLKQIGTHFMVSSFDSGMFISIRKKNLMNDNSRYLATYSIFS